MQSMLIRACVFACLTMLCACAANSPMRARESRPSLGTLRESDLEPCMAITADAGNTAADAIKADAQTRGDHMECQQRQSALLGVVRQLIDDGVLKETTEGQ